MKKKSPNSNAPSQKNSFEYEEIDKEEIIFKKDENGKLKEIGRGSFGKVYLATYKGKEVAVKKIYEKYEITENSKKEYTTISKSEIEENEQLSINENDLLRNAGHKNIVKCFGLFKDENERVCLVTKFCKMGSLEDYIFKNKGKISNKTKINICMGLVVGLRFLHSKNILHRDLKPDNVLLLERDKLIDVMICDFGLSKISDGKTNSDKPVGTRAFLAPEIKENKKKNTKKSDVFSLGKTMWNVIQEITYKKASKGENIPNKQISDEKETGGKVNEFNDKTDEKRLEKLKEICEKCMTEDPNERMDLSEVFMEMKSLCVDFYELSKFFNQKHPIVNYIIKSKKIRKNNSEDHRDVFSFLEIHLKKLFQEYLITKV